MIGPVVETTPSPVVINALADIVTRGTVKLNPVLLPGCIISKLPDMTCIPILASILVSIVNGTSIRINVLIVVIACIYVEIVPTSMRTVDFMSMLSTAMETRPTVTSTERL